VDGEIELVKPVAVVIPNCGNNKSGRRAGSLSDNMRRDQNAVGRDLYAVDKSPKVKDFRFRERLSNPFDIG
jgi:hypothetical protein